MNIFLEKVDNIWASDSTQPKPKDSELYVKDIQGVPRYTIYLLGALRSVQMLHKGNIGLYSLITLDTLSKSFFSIPHFNSGIDHFILLKWGIDFRNWIPNAGIEHFILLKWGIHFRNWELMPEVNSFTLLIKSGIDFRHWFPIPTSFRR